MKKIFALLIMCSLSLPVSAIDEQEVGLTPIDEKNIETVVSETNSEYETSVLQEELKPVPVSLPSKYKEPVSKKKLAKKFIIAMLCVAGASIFLYLILSLYNKIRNAIIPQPPMPPEGEKPLDAPNDLTEAIKTFIEKTKWDN